MSKSDISEQSTIATLPKPVDAKKGRFHSAPVYSLTGSRKRKRREVAVGVDGETVNIYDIQQQTSVASYPLPTQSYLAAPPCSIYCKRSKSSKPIRRSYFALRDGQTEDRVRLVNYTEVTGRPKDQVRAVQAPAKRERKLRRSDVSALDIIPRLSTSHDEDDASGILVSYRDGSIDYVAGDLSGSIWEHTPGPAIETGEVEYSAILDFDTACKGILRGREDVIARLDTDSTTNARIVPLLLFQVVQKEGQRRVKLQILRDLSKNVLRNQQAPVEEILSYDLPSRSGVKRATYELHGSSGTLYQLFDTLLNVFDLTGTLPRVVSELGRKHSMHINSFAHRSEGSVLAVSSSRIVIYETKYGSATNSLSITSGSPEAMGQGEIAQSGILAFFSDLGFLVVRLGLDVVVFHVSGGMNRKRKLPYPLLADVVGGGQAFQFNEHRSSSEKMTKSETNLEKWKSQVNQSLERNDLQGLEDLVADSIDLKKLQRTSRPHIAAMIDGHLNSGLTVWGLEPQDYDAQNIDSRKAMFLMEKMFCMRRREDKDSLNEGRLATKFKSLNILRWLALTGHLKSRFVDHAITSATGYADGSPVQPGDLVEALFETDSSFLIICELMALPIDWEIHELIKTLSLLIRSLDTSLEAESPLLLTQNPTFDNDVTMDDAATDSLFEAEAAAAANELEHAETMFNDGLRIRSETLRLLMTRLDRLAKDDIVRAMREQLSHEEITFFIAILRIELRDGRWTSRHVEDGPDDMGIEEPSDFGHAEQITISEQALRTIAKLLNCCVDAVGISGWLVGQSGEHDGTLALVETVRAEVSAALEGCLEAETIAKYLCELTRLAGAEELRRNKGQVDDELGLGLLVMPLGGRFAPPEVKTLNSSKEGKKSRSQIAKQRSRAVGKYTFEQIRF